MDDDEFWSIVKEARAEAAALGGYPDADTLGAAFFTVLSKRPHSLVAYGRRFGELHAALYRWDVWAAAYRIHGGCGDDNFIDFRTGVIALGREWHDRVVADPDSLADHPLVRAIAVGTADDDGLFAEQVDVAFSNAFTAAAVRDDLDPAEGAERPAGEDFDFDDDTEMSRRLPRLAALFAE